MNNDYEYVKTPLTRPIARKLVIEEFSGKVAERQEIIDTIVKLKGESSWPCKVGESERDPAIRVESQAATAMPEQPKIALLIQTDKPFELEKAIHKLLAKYGKQIQEAPGAEWFSTSPSEVEEIHAILLPLNQRGDVADDNST